MPRGISACPPIVHPSAYAVLLVFITVALLFSSIAYGEPFQAQERALELITSTADRICGEASTRGEARSSELQGNVQAQLRGLASKLADAGISGSARLTSEQYQNVIREDLAANLRDIRACKLKIVDTLKDALLGAAVHQPSPLAADPRATRSYWKNVEDIRNKYLQEAAKNITNMIQIGKMLSNTKKDFYNDELDDASMKLASLARTASKLLFKMVSEETDISMGSVDHDLTKFAADSRVKVTHLAYNLEHLASVLESLSVTVRVDESLPLT